MGTVFRLLQKVAAEFGVGVTARDDLESLSLAAPDGPQMLTLASDALGLGEDRKSQLGQEVVALLHSGLKQGGYFVEFGATNGVDLSNTYALENRFGWTGILAEPARCWHAALKSNRSAIIDTDCVWAKSGQILEFNMVDAGEFSTIASFNECDRHRQRRTAGEQYEVSTVSLNDLLSRHHAPAFIDYLSIDTEGSEYEILSAFDFAKHRFGFISCEHNHTSNREKIHSLLTAHGYRRSLLGLSQWDDWYFSEIAPGS